MSWVEIKNDYGDVHILEDGVERVRSQQVGDRPAEVVAHRIRDLRLTLGLTQQEVVELMKERTGYSMDRATLARIERLQRPPTLDETFIFSAALDIPYVYLVTPEDEYDLMDPYPSHRAVASGTVRSWLEGHHEFPNQRRDRVSEHMIRATARSRAYELELQQINDQVDKLLGLDADDEEEDDGRYIDQEEMEDRYRSLSQSDRSGIATLRLLRRVLALKRESMLTIGSWPSSLTERAHGYGHVAGLLMAASAQAFGPGKAEPDDELASRLSNAPVRQLPPDRRMWALHEVVKTFMDELDVGLRAVIDSIQPGDLAAGSEDAGNSETSPTIGTLKRRGPRSQEKPS